MATRATYRFEAGPHDYRPAITFYVHWDGYPEGAASKFREVLEGTGGYMTPEGFCKYVDGAEFTAGHEAHGDTEYRYTFNAGGDLRVDRWKPGEEFKFVGVYALAEFLNWQLVEERAEWLTKGNQTLPMAAWLEKLDQLMSGARDRLDKGQTGNASATFGDAARLCAVLLAHRPSGAEALVAANLMLQEFGPELAKRMGWREEIQSEYAARLWPELVAAEPAKLVMPKTA